MLENQRAQSGAEPVPDGLGVPPAAASHATWLGARKTLVPRAKRTRPGAYTDPVTWATAIAVLGAYSTISLSRLIQLNPSSWDLGIFTEYVKQYADLRAPIVDIRATGFNLLGDHFQPIVAVLAPFFRVFPSAATLLIGQALLAAASVFAVSQAAREKLGTGPGRAVAIAYGFSWGLQQMVNFDFHEIAFAVPLLAFSLSALARGRTRAALLWALPLVFVKEDQGFTVAAIGLYLVLSGLRGPAPEPATASMPAPASLPAPAGDTTEDPDAGVQPATQAEPATDPDPAANRQAGDPQAGDPQAGDPQAGDPQAGDPQAGDPQAGGHGRILAGQFLLVWGFAWSFVAIAVIIPHFNPAHQYDYWSDGGVLAPGGHTSLSGLIGQFLHAWPDKLQTLVMLLLPTAFIALRSPIALIAVPSLLLRFLSTDSSFWGTVWHYNATVMPILFIAAVDALARIRAGMDPADATGRHGPRRALLAGAQRYGPAMMLAIAVPLAFQFPLNNLWNAQTYRVSPHVEAADAAMARVPSGTTVQATLDLLAPLAARTDVFWLGNAGNPVTQYIVFDGVDSDYSPAVSNVPAFIAQLYPDDIYTLIFDDGDVYVFRRDG
ncbi:MAG: DUF2079 domain-containing protein [Streptosporangiaceae bacterium]